MTLLINNTPKNQISLKKFKLHRYRDMLKLTYDDVQVYYEFRNVHLKKHVGGCGCVSEKYKLYDPKQDGLPHSNMVLMIEDYVSDMLFDPKHLDKFSNSMVLRRSVLLVQLCETLSACVHTIERL